jgi:histidinol phosphatase-like PHP family hydrolase
VYTDEGLFMESPKYDFHIHTKYLKCANETMEVAAIIEECTRNGATALAITDHFNGVESLPLHSEIRRDLESLEATIDVYFGVELNFVGCDQGFGYDKSMQDDTGFQFAIGGIHTAYAGDEYNVNKVVDVQHRHHLATCADPLVEVLVHPYWFSMNDFRRNDWPWFGTMDVVPESYARELGQASKESGTAIEINAHGNVVVNAAHDEAYVEGYFEYLSIMAAEGAKFSLGSDAHQIHKLSGITDVWRMVERLDLTPEQIWQPSCEPIIRGSR